MSATSDSLWRDDPVLDSGVHCPTCRYNLTGLSEQRCPECGTPFDWEELHWHRWGPSPIAFERGRGWRRMSTFIQTWATIVFAPWIFARQVTRRANLRHAAAFALLCGLLASSALLVEYDPEVLGIWMLTATAFVLIQTMLLTLLDVPGWSRPIATLRFWLIAGCYTCAVMATEILGPPLVVLTDLRTLIRDGTGGTFEIDYLYRANWAGLAQWAQIAAWLAGVGCCYFARLRSRKRRAVLAGLATLIVVAALLLLYAAAVQLVIRLAVRWFF